MRFGGKPALGLLCLCGVGLMLYPAASNWLAVRNHSRAIVDYGVTVEALAEREIAQELERARDYNRSLTAAGVGEPFDGAADVPPPDYFAALQVGGMMGYIDVPAIQVHLPIYHTTSAEVLRKGVGHMSTSAFPVGGPGTHCVLTAHRGLPSAKLFTDLVELEEGDLFTVTVLGQVLGYRVDRVATVEPHETGALQPVEGRDYLTLVTCTPYAINSHRLLVRGERIPAGEAAAGIPEAPEEKKGGAVLLAGVALALLAAVAGLACARKLRRR